MARAVVIVKRNGDRLGLFLRVGEELLRGLPGLVAVHGGMALVGHRQFVRAYYLSPYGILALEVVELEAHLAALEVGLLQHRSVLAICCHAACLLAYQMIAVCIAVVDGSALLRVATDVSGSGGSDRVIVSHAVAYDGLVVDVGHNASRNADAGAAYLASRD